jgi:hypothetical protein
MYPGKKPACPKTFSPTEKPVTSQLSEAFLPLSLKSMADPSSPDYKVLYLQAEERRKQEAEGRRQAEERNRPTTFVEHI